MLWDVVVLGRLIVDEGDVRVQGGGCGLVWLVVVCWLRGSRFSILFTKA